MKDLEIHGNLTIWIYNFLTRRKQVVIANGAKSSESSVASGVPQGTVLGPLLFLIMINDIDTNISESIISIFADDTRLTKVIRKEEDLEDFQEDLEKLYTWASENNMAFNGSTFEVLRDLGVIMNIKATLKDHTDKVCSQVNQKAGWVLRTFKCRKNIFYEANVEVSCAGAH